MRENNVETNIICVHDDHNGDIHIYQREWTDGVPGDKVDIGPIQFDWYFLIAKADARSIDSIRQSSLIIRTEEDGNYIRIYCSNRNYNKWKREAGAVDAKMLLVKEFTELGVTTYEADLASYQRYMIDNDIQMGGKFLVLYFDIETDDRGNGIEIGRDQIISFAAYDPFRKKTFYYSGENERGLIKTMLKLFARYDVLAGWNSDGFDMPYIQARARQYGLEKDLYNLMGVQRLDLLKKFQETYGRDTDMVRRFRSFKLQDVANYFLGYGKIERGSTYEMYLNDPAKLKEYNIRDVKLLADLEEKTGVVDLSIIKAQICGARLNEKTSGRVLDNYIIRAANKTGVHYRTVLSGVIIQEDDIEASYIGGHVFTPSVGLHRDVVLFDFSSLYPSIIRTFNISPDTYLGEWDSGLTEPDSDGPFVLEHTPRSLGNDIGAPAGFRYKSQKGVMPSLIHDLVVKRNDMRKKEMPKLDPNSFEYQNMDKKQYVYKILANSMYGILGAPFFRYYDRNIAESITRTGHYLVKSASQWFRDRGYETIYGDTDSIFVKIPGGEPGTLGDELRDYFNEILREKFNIHESFIVMDYKTSFTKFLIVAKKKYVGLEKSGKLELTGFELIKRDTVPIAAKMQGELFDMLIKNDVTEVDVVEWLENHKKYILEGKVSADEITIYKKLTKKPESFVAFTKGGKLPLHVKVFMDHEEITPGDLEVGSYIPHIITNGKPLDGVHPIRFDGSFDRSYYWNNRIYPILDRVLAVAFPDSDWDRFLIDKPVSRKRKVDDPDKPKRKRRVKVVEVEE